MNKRHLKYKRKNGKNKKSFRTNNHNNGQILEDIINERLNKYKLGHREKGTFYSVAENVDYYVGGVRYEIDNFFIRNHNNKSTLALFEDKLGDHRGKAYKQLKRHVNYVKENFNFDKIICFYAHGLNRRTKKYKIEHVKTLDYVLR